jgi:hypothetical protein
VVRRRRRGAVWGKLCCRESKLCFLSNRRRTMASADFCFFTMPHLRTLRLSFTPSPSPMRPSSPNARPYSVCSSTPCQHHRDRGTSSLQARAHRQHHHDLTLRNQYAHIVPAHCCSHPLSRHTNGHSIGYAMLTHQAETGQHTAVESHALSECSARRNDALDPGAPCTTIYATFVGFVLAA